MSFEIACACMSVLFYFFFNIYVYMFIIFTTKYDACFFAYFDISKCNLCTHTRLIYL